MEIKGEIRKSYTKPRVTQVNLEIQDAVLLSCKSATVIVMGAQRDKLCSASPSCKKLFGS